jgi:hypothetical protein
MAKHQRRRKAQRTLTLKVSGPDIRPGRIPIPELLTILQHTQSVVNRQAEALEGRAQTLRRGPKIGKVLHECTLELVSIGKGSATLGFDPAKPQPSLPHMANLGSEAVATVAAAIAALSKSKSVDIDPGVLDSLKSLGELFGNGVRSIQWSVRAQAGRKRITATFNARAQRRVVEKLKPPVTRSVSIDGVLEMADFKPSDHRCRIHPAMGQPINCTFDPPLADQIYNILRQAARVEGTAIVNSRTGRTESIRISKVTPLNPLTVNAGGFFQGWSIDQLAQAQGVEPLRDPKVLAGGWPDDEDVDDVLTDIYQHRQ